MFPRAVKSTECPCPAVQRKEKGEALWVSLGLENFKGNPVGTSYTFSAINPWMLTKVPWVLNFS